MPQTMDSVPRPSVIPMRRDCTGPVFPAEAGIRNAREELRKLLNEDEADADEQEEPGTV